jgi:hypothetical protein
MNLREEINKIKLIDDHVHALDDVQWIQGTGSYPWPANLGSVQLPNAMTTLPQKEALFTAYRELYDFYDTELTPENAEKLNQLYLDSLSEEIKIFDKAIAAGNMECVIEVNQDSLDYPGKPGMMDHDKYKLAPWWTAFWSPWTMRSTA